jgi:hypothetical protein
MATCLLVWVTTSGHFLFAKINYIPIQRSDDTYHTDSLAPLDSSFHHFMIIISIDQWSLLLESLHTLEAEAEAPRCGIVGNPCL